MWEILGWSTLVLVVAGGAWLLVRLLWREQSRDRSYDSNEDMTSNEATSHEPSDGSGGASAD